MVPLALAGAYATLAVLVATGALRGIDQWSVDHLMPGSTPSSHRQTLAEAAVPLLHVSWRPLHALENLVLLPASFLVSLLLVAAACLALHTRGRTAEASRWAIAWLAAGAVELLCKETLTRPPLYVNRVHVPDLDSSLPSGHTVRAILLVAALAAAWPAARWWLAAWAVTAIILLEVGGFHTPTDIAGGALLAGLLVLLTRRWYYRPS